MLNELAASRGVFPRQQRLASAVETTNRLLEVRSELFETIERQRGVECAEEWAGWLKLTHAIAYVQKG